MTPTPTAPAGVKEQAIAIIERRIGEWEKDPQSSARTNVIIELRRCMINIEALQSLPAPVEGDAVADLETYQEWRQMQKLLAEITGIGVGSTVAQFRSAWQAGQQAAGEKEFITNAKYTPETCPYTHDPNLLTVAVCNHCGFKPHGPNPPKTNQP